MPLDLDSCIEGIFTPGNIGASSGLPPVVPTMPSLVGPMPAVLEPTSASDTLEAFFGELLHEVASALDSCSSTGGAYPVLIAEAAAAVDTVYFAQVFDKVVGEVAEATDAPSVYVPGVIDATVSEAAAADSVQDGALFQTWTLVSSWTHSSNVAQVDFTGLTGYTEIRVLLRLVTCTGSGQRRLRVSTDNGSTFLSTTGDYIIMDGDGNPNNSTGISLHTTASTGARSAEILISGWNLTARKLGDIRNRTDFIQVVMPTSSALNALRINDTSGGNLSGGSIYVWARQ